MANFPGYDLETPAFASEGLTSLVGYDLPCTGDPPSAPPLGPRILSTLDTNEGGAGFEARSTRARNTT